MMMDEPATDCATVVAITGMAIEAGIARRAYGVAAFTPGDVVAAAECCASPRIRAVVSFGIAGGLDPRLAAGMLVVGTETRTLAGASFGTSRPLAEAWCSALGSAGRAFFKAPVAHSDSVILSPAGKLKLGQTTGAAAVDMESMLAAELALRYGLAYGVLRVVADSQSRPLPELATSAVGASGRLDWNSIGRHLASEPLHAAALCGIGVDFARALLGLFHAAPLLSLIPISECVSPGAPPDVPAWSIFPLEASPDSGVRSS